MNIDFVFKIAGIGILVTVLSQVLSKAGREDIAMLASLSGLVVVLVMVVDMISQFFMNIRNAFAL